MLTGALRQVHEGRCEYRSLIGKHRWHVTSEVSGLLHEHDNNLAGIGYYVGSLSNRLYLPPKQEERNIKLAVMLFGIIMGNLDNLTDDESAAVNTEYKIELLHHFRGLLSGEITQAKYYVVPAIHELELLALEFHKITDIIPEMNITGNRLVTAVKNQLTHLGEDEQSWMSIARDTGGNTAGMTLGFAKFFSPPNPELDRAIFEIGTWMQISDDITDRSDDKKRGQRTFATECGGLNLTKIELEYRSRVSLALKSLNPDAQKNLAGLMRYFRFFNWINSSQMMRKNMGRKSPKLPTPSASS